MNILRLVILLIISGPGLFAQRVSDVGILMSTDNDIKILVEYRKPINEKIKLKLGFGYGYYYTGFSDGWYEIHTTDTSITSKKRYSNIEKFNLKIGVERQIKNGPFSVGLDLLLGYTNADYMMRERNYVLGENGQWEYQRYTNTTDFNSISQISPEFTYARTTINYFKPALQLYLGLDLPLGERFLVNLSFINSAGLVMNVGEKNKIDPYNEFDYLKKTRLDFSSRLGIGLRYRFNK